MLTGRGGAGNLRTPSREPAVAPFQYDNKEDALIHAAEAHPAVVRSFPLPAPVLFSDSGQHSSGRGGAGNILHAHGAADNHVSTEHEARPDIPPRVESGSRSRSRVGRMVGRGGAGNFKLDTEGHTSDATMAQDDIEARRAIAEASRGREREAPHSTGRGGAANITSLPSPAPEPFLAHGAHAGESTGRGGAGNILRGARSGSRDPTSPGAEVSTGIPILERDADAVGARAVDARGEARSSSRGPTSSRERSVERFLNKITHPFAPHQRTIVE
jgi:hypothetical protein